MKKGFWMELDFCDGYWKRYTIGADGAVCVTVPISGTDRTVARWIGNFNKRGTEA